METLNTTADNSEVHQQTIDDRLEKVVQDFNEFRERVLQSSSSAGMQLEDLVDLYIDNGGENSHSTQDEVITLLEDFNEFESILPPQVESTHIEDGFGINDDIRVRESEMMIKEMAEETSQDGTGSFPAASHTVNINLYVGTGSSSTNRVICIRHGDLNNSEAAGALLGSIFGDGNETVFGSVMRFFRMMNDVNIRTTRRKRVKRKYRGVTETEEATARQMEITRVKNSEAAAKANAK